MPKDLHEINIANKRTKELKDHMNFIFEIGPTQITIIVLAYSASHMIASRYFFNSSSTFRTSTNLLPFCPLSIYFIFCFLAFHSFVPMQPTILTEVSFTLRALYFRSNQWKINNSIAIRSRTKLLIRIHHYSFVLLKLI
jgi:hypothetical protein